ncbi:MAG: hypothetical protein ACUVXA_15915 [Candidatus Jordarchaeum sp.]|uniref:hypothetical protein n=1 Tax=Candidatus Jordarchaeum sp. TaxID=2823881 RepID=UPI00404B8F29
MTELYQEGYPEIRKYCSPLQAIFWLAENGVLDASLLDNFSLEKLLKKAWMAYGPHCLSKNEISEIILNLNFKKEFYLVKKKFDSDEEIQK